MRAVVAGPATRRSSRRSPAGTREYGDVADARRLGRRCRACRGPDVTVRAVVWLFAVLAALLVFAIAAATVGREAFRLGHQPPPTIFDLDEAVAQVADALPFDVQGRLTYDEVRELILAELDHLESRGVLAAPGDEVALQDGGTPDVVVADDDAVAVVLGRAEALEMDVTDGDVFQVIAALLGYLAEIGAVGPPASP